MALYDSRRGRDGFCEWHIPRTHRIAARLSLSTAAHLFSHSVWTIRNAHENLSLLFRLSSGIVAARLGHSPHSRSAHFVSADARGRRAGSAELECGRAEKVGDPECHLLLPHLPLPRARLDSQTHVHNRVNVQQRRQRPKASIVENNTALSKRNCRIAAHAGVGTSQSFDHFGLGSSCRNRNHNHNGQ